MLIHVFRWLWYMYLSFLGRVKPLKKGLKSPDHISCNTFESKIMSAETPRILILGRIAYAQKELDQLKEIYQVDHATSKDREEFYQDIKIKYNDISVIYRASGAGEHFYNLDAEFASHLPRTLTLFIVAGADNADVDINAFEKQNFWVSKVPDVTEGSAEEAAYASELAILDAITLYLTSLPAPPAYAVNRVVPNTPAIESATALATVSNSDLFDGTVEKEEETDIAGEPETKKNFWQLSRAQKRASQVLDQLDFSGGFDIRLN
ncbi:hypothetical protein BC937DRAFT_95064 [Endogone sp. FLAS-F59071]|nr:hypothetical protein BC937DRAFT_95064 [Endogone sp. FLAS-F59071]|eukprot:RUS20495.1 hypothetical protein BC937DRAFT_95064 [Endogone sp. FLAS-F59071]